MPCLSVVERWDESRQTSLRYTEPHNHEKLMEYAIIKMFVRSNEDCWHENWEMRSALEKHDCGSFKPASVSSRGSPIIE